MKKFRYIVVNNHQTSKLEEGLLIYCLLIYSLEKSPKKVTSPQARC